MKRISYSAKTIIQRGGKYLVIRRSVFSKNNAGVWDFPGGKVDSGEDALKAVAREVGEETGLNLIKAVFIGTTEVELSDRIVRYFMYKANVANGAVVLSSEHDRFRWVSKKDMLEFDMLPQLESFIRNKMRW